MESEIRSLKGELRAAPGFKLTGLAARYNVCSFNLGGFVEKIVPGAFSSSLAAGDKIVITHNHDASRVLGSTKSGTGKVWDSPEGLRFSVQLDPANTIHSDVYNSVKRGDLDSNSFAFVAPSDGSGEMWADGGVDEKGQPCKLRTLTNVALKDVAVVCYPAYPTTQVDARSLTERGLLRVAPRSVPITPEALARGQGFASVAEMEKASLRAARAVLNHQANQIADCQDRDLHARAERCRRIIEADEELARKENLALRKAECVLGIIFGRRSKADPALGYPYEAAGTGAPETYPYAELAAAISKSFPDHKLLGANSSQAYTKHASGSKWTVPYEQDSAGNYSFGKPSVGGHPIWLSGEDVS